MRTDALPGSGLAQWRGRLAAESASRSRRVIAEHFKYCEACSSIDHAFLVTHQNATGFVYHVRQRVTAVSHGVKVGGVLFLSGLERNV